jgi:hypothetical protein
MYKLCEKIQKEITFWSNLIIRQLSAIAYDKYGVGEHNSADNES